MARCGRTRRAAELEDQSNELVVSADSGPVEPSQMKIGLVVGEPLDAEELERYAAGLEAQPMDFENEDDGSVVRMEVDGTSTVVKPPRQESAATTEAGARAGRPGSFESSARHARASDQDGRRANRGGTTRSSCRWRRSVALASIARRLPRRVR